MNVEVHEEALVARLMVENTEFKQLEQEHRKLEDNLMAYETHVYLSPEEELERKRLQKLKLAAKDRMMDIIRRTKVGRA